MDKKRIDGKVYYLLKSPTSIKEHICGLCGDTIPSDTTYYIAKSQEERLELEYGHTRVKICAWCWENGDQAPNKHKGSNSMKLNSANAAALVRDDITTLGLTHHGDSTIYTYKCLRSLAETLKLRDSVVVVNTNGIRLGVVTKIDEEPDIDAFDKYTLCWAFQRVDTELLQTLEEQDSEIAKKIEAKQRENVRRQVLTALGFTDPTSIQELLPNKE